MKTKEIIKKVLIAVLVFIFVTSSAPVCFGTQKTEELTDEQKTSIAMLNYLTVLTKEINESDHSRLDLEDAYSSLINNTYPNAVDEETEAYLEDLLDTINDYRKSTGNEKNRQDEFPDFSRFFPKFLKILSSF